MDITLHFHTVSRMLSDKGLEENGRVQKVVDREVLRRCDPYVPMLTGNLKRSGITGTVIGSGTVTWKCVYAYRQYYNNAGKGRQGTAKHNSHNYKCLRGKLWFERMKADHMNDIEEAARRAVSDSDNS